MDTLINQRNGHAVDAIDITCDCGAPRCDVTIRVPATAVQPPAGRKQTAKTRATVIHNLVQKRRMLGYPEV